MLSWGFWGFLNIVIVYDVSNEHLRPILYICTIEVGIVWVFCPSHCKVAVVSVNGGVVLLSYAIVPCAKDVPTVVSKCRAAYDRG